MKNLMSIMLLLIVAWSCSTSQKAGATHRQLTIKSDSTEYEITITDPEFDHWYLLNFSPAKDYSNEYYRGKNQVAVSNWNNYFTRNRYNGIIEDYIYYDYSVDYGIDVNRKLYWYFKYVEDSFKIKLLR